MMQNVIHHLMKQRNRAIIYDYGSSNCMGTGTRSPHHPITSPRQRGCTVHTGKPKQKCSVWLKVGRDHGDKMERWKQQRRERKGKVTHRHGFAGTEIFSAYDDVSLELVGVLFELRDADVRLLQHRLKGVNKFFAASFCFFDFLRH